MFKKKKFIIAMLVILYYLISIALIYVPAILNKGIKPMTNDITLNLSYSTMLGQILIFNTILLIVVVFVKYIAFTILNDKFKTNLDMDNVLISVLIVLNIFVSFNTSSFNPMIMAVFDILLIGLFEGLFTSKDGSILTKVIITESISAIVIFITAVILLSFFVSMFTV